MAKKIVKKITSDEDLEFINEDIGYAIVNQMLENDEFRTRVEKVFDNNWFSTNQVSDLRIIDIAINQICKFNKKYGKIPSKSELTSCIKNQINKSHVKDIDGSNIMNLFNGMDKVKTFDKDVMNKNIGFYIEGVVWSNRMFKSVEDYNSRSYVEQGRVWINELRTYLEDFKDFDVINTKPIVEFNMNITDFLTELEKPEEKIKTGFDKLDQLLNGGFPKNGKTLNLFMAQAGLGKSAFLSNIAVNCMKQNLKVCLVTLEMSTQLYSQRLASHISKVNINKLVENNEEVKTKLSEFTEKYPDSKCFIAEYPPRSISCDDIENYLNRLVKNNQKPDILIVDYLTLIEPKNHFDNMYKDGLTVSEELRAISYKFEIPIVSAIQTNTEGMNSDKISLKNISESRGISHTADFIGAIYGTEDPSQRVLKILKNRLGGQLDQTVLFSLDRENLTLEENEFGNNTIKLLDLE